MTAEMAARSFRTIFIVGKLRMILGLAGEIPDRVLGNKFPWDFFRFHRARKFR
jgi:hypothetical protein